jgi:hypothetical protein
MTISPDGATLVPGQAGSLITPSGMWSFGLSTDARGGRIVWLNGRPLSPP